MNYNGLPKDPEDGDEYLASFDKVMGWISNGLLIVGIFSIIVVLSFAWGCYVG